MISKTGKRISRRRALVGAASGVASLAFAGCSASAPSTATGVPGTAGAKTAPAQSSAVKWKLQSYLQSTQWEYGEPVLFAKMVDEMSGGRLKIETIPVGTVVPAGELLEAVHSGLLDATHCWPGYWYGKNSAAALFGSIPGGPFGMDHWDYLGWIFEGGGIDLYNELLQKEMKLNVIAFAMFGECPEAMGWFDKPVKTVADFKGLKFRASGLTLEVFKEMGLSVVQIAGGDLLPALERGTVDAAEWGDPSADLSTGFHEVRKYYHLPGIHQPTGISELTINKSKWDELSDDLKATVKYAALLTAYRFQALTDRQNATDTQTLVEKHGVTIVETPKEVLYGILDAWDRLAEAKSKENPFFAKVLQSQKEYAQGVVVFRSKGHPDYRAIAERYWGRSDPFKVLKP